MLSQQSMLLIDDILAKFCFFFFGGGKGAGWRGSVLSLFSYRDDWMTRLLFTRITTTTRKKKKTDSDVFFLPLPFLLCSAAAENMAVIPEWLGI